jgi:hypothetical protein
MILKPQDILVALKGSLIHGKVTLAELARTLGLSASEVHASVKRGRQAQLVRQDDDAFRTVRDNLLEFLIHGTRYAFPPDRGGLTRGMPTAHAAPILAAEFAKTGAPPVWPDPLGTARGEAFSPLYRSVPFAAKTDTHLYALLALVDAIRGGSARERAVATRLLTRQLP